MKIHIFIAHMGVGGAERVCVNLANELAERGHEVHILVLNLDNDINTHLLNKRVAVHSLGVSRLRYSVFAMLKYIKTYQPPFLFVFGNEMAVILNKLKKLHLTKVPVIVRVLNNVEISLSKEDNISPLVEGYLKKAQKQLADMNHVIAQCSAMGEMLLNKKLVEKEKLTVVYNPVSRDLIRKVKEIRVPNENREDGRTYEIVFIGRIDPQKNLSHLLKAFAFVHERMKNTCLRLVGDGNVTEQMKKLAEELNIAEAVLFDGIRSDMEQVYAGADVVALSSEYEGMPNCLIEAIGCGVPVVSYDCPLGPREIIEDGVNGFLVEYNNIDELAEKLILALNRKWQETEICKTAAKFDVTYIAGEYERIFKECAE